MAFDKFISNVRTKVAKKFGLKTDAEIDAFFIGMEESARDNQEALEKRDKMLRDTVAELVEAKRLLKLAVEDMHIEDMCDVCVERIPNSSIHCPDGSNCFVWRYKDEALKLIGGSENG